MSLILDALRKSEHQRQRQAGPGLAVVPESPENPRPATWILVLGGLLALNILVLAAVLLTGGEPEPVTVAPPAPAASAPAPQVPARAPLERPRATPVTLPPKPPRDEVRPLTTEIAPPTAAPAPRAQPGGSSTTADAPRAPAPAASAERANADARLPRFSDLVVRGDMNVPHMHLDIHVFSENPGERFVFINMRRYDEGQATQEGPRIERIARDGVIMDYQGQRFFLPRD